MIANLRVRLAAVLVVNLLLTSFHEPGVSLIYFSVEGIKKNRLARKLTLSI